VTTEQDTDTEGELYTPTESGDSDKTRNQRRALVRRLHKIIRRTKQAEKRYRNRCIQGVEYFFGDQWSEEAAKVVKDRGQEPVVVNRVKPTVNLVHGLVVSRPVDWQAKPVGRHDDQLAEIGNASLKFIANVQDYPSIRARVYWWALVYGFQRK
jgi:hypothetical protein